MGIKTYTQYDVDEILQRAKEDLDIYHTAVKDVRYIIRQYRDRAPEDAWQTILKIVNDPKVK